MWLQHSLDVQDEKLGYEGGKSCKERGISALYLSVFRETESLQQSESTTRIWTLRNGHVPFLPFPPIMQVTVTGRTLVLFVKI